MHWSELCQVWCHSHATWNSLIGTKNIGKYTMITRPNNFSNHWCQRTPSPWSSDFLLKLCDSWQNVRNLSNRNISWFCLTAVIKMTPGICDDRSTKLMWNGVCTTRIKCSKTARTLVLRYFQLFMLLATVKLDKSWCLSTSNYCSVHIHLETRIQPDTEWLVLNTAENIPWKHNLKISETVANKALHTISIAFFCWNSFVSCWS